VRNAGNKAFTGIPRFHGRRKMAESDFHKIKRLLIERKIDFTPSDEAEPRFAIQGVPFTTQELIQLANANKLTNLDLPEIIRTRRST